jgi:hypothetical protein
MPEFFVKSTAPAYRQHSPALVSQLVSEVLGGHRPTSIKRRGLWAGTRYNREHVWTVTVSKQAAKVIEQKVKPLIDAGDRPTLRFEMAHDLWVELDGNQFKDVVRGVIGYGKFQQAMSVSNASVAVSSGATIEDEEEQL